MSLKQIIDQNLKTKTLNLVEECQEGQDFCVHAVIFLAKEKKHEQKKKILNWT